MYIKICCGKNEGDYKTLESEKVFEVSSFEVDYLKENLILSDGEIIPLSDSTTYIMNDRGETIDKFVFSSEDLTQEDMNNAEHINLDDFDFIGPIK